LGLWSDKPCVLTIRASLLEPGRHPTRRAGRSATNLQVGCLTKIGRFASVGPRPPNIVQVMVSDAGPGPKDAQGDRALPRVGGLLLAPGAGASRDHSALVAIDDALTGAGLAVERMDFPYRQAGRRWPDSESVLVSSVVAAARALCATAEVPAERVALGGRSMGGRMCSIAVARGLRAACLVLVSYPLHPPARPDKLRVGHFASLEVPCLFVSGTRDRFGSPAELEAATAAIAGPVTHVFIDGADHSLSRRDDQVASIVAEWLLALQL